MVDSTLIKGHGVDTGENGTIITICTGAKEGNKTEHIEFERFLGIWIEITILDSSSELAWKL